MKKMVKNGYRISLVNSNYGGNICLNSIRVDEKIYSPLLKRDAYTSVSTDNNMEVRKICYGFLMSSSCDFEDKKRQQQIERDFKNKAVQILDILAQPKKIY